MGAGDGGVDALGSGGDGLDGRGFGRGAADVVVVRQVGMGDAELRGDGEERGMAAEFLVDVFPAGGAGRWGIDRTWFFSFRFSVVGFQLLASGFLLYWLRHSDHFCDLFELLGNWVHAEILCFSARRASSCFRMR